jgi:hypothetical protein
MQYPHWSFHLNFAKCNWPKHPYWFQQKNRTFLANPISCILHNSRRYINKQYHKYFFKLLFQVSRRCKPLQLKWVSAFSIRGGWRWLSLLPPAQVLQPPTLDMIPVTEKVIENAELSDAMVQHFWIAAQGYDKLSYRGEQTMLLHDITLLCQPLHQKWDHKYCCIPHKIVLAMRGISISWSSPRSVWQM